MTSEGELKKRLTYPYAQSDNINKIIDEAKKEFQTVAFAEDITKVHVDVGKIIMFNGGATRSEAKVYYLKKLIGKWFGE